MKEIFSSGDSAAIAVARSMIEAAGITCETRNDAVSQALVGAPFYSELWVRDEDYAAAAELLAEFRGNT